MKEPPKGLKALNSADFDDETYVEGFASGVLAAYELLKESASTMGAFAAPGERIFREEELQHLDSVMNGVYFTLLERINTEIVKRLTVGTYSANRT